MRLLKGFKSLAINGYTFLCKFTLYRYPMAAKQHIHRTKVYLPQDIALALYKDPSLVQKAVETFYTRDAIQMRVST